MFQGKESEVDGFRWIETTKIIYILRETVKILCILLHNQVSLSPIGTILASRVYMINKVIERIISCFVAPSKTFVKQNKSTVCVLTLSGCKITNNTPTSQVFCKNCSLRNLRDQTHIVGYASVLGKGFI